MHRENWLVSLNMLELNVVTKVGMVTAALSYLCYRQCYHNNVVISVTLCLYIIIQAGDLILVSSFLLSYIRAHWVLGSFLICLFVFKTILFLFLVYCSSF